jgi:TonB-linked SusC/RagA family outer membrane protein
MKHIKTGIILCFVLTLFPVMTTAQSVIEENIEDTVYTPNGEPVQLAFRTVEKKDLLGGVSVINLPEYMEKNYTSFAIEGMEAFAGGFNGNIWGMGSYLTLIDGVPRDGWADVRTSEIEQITLLKNAAAVALYGSKAAKGVILITTKRGEANKQKINIRANTGFYTPVGYPEYLGAAEYMTLYNEARRNDGLADLYSPETIYNTYAKTNPYRYPDVDYYSSEYLKNKFNSSNITAEVSGGNERAQFYTNIGYINEGSLLNFGEAKNDNANRFNVRGNVDLKLNEYVTGTADATAIFNNNRYSFGNYWGQAANLRPNRFAPLIPVSMLEASDENSFLFVENSKHLIDGKYLLGGSQQDLTTPFGDIYASGYGEGASRQFQFNVGLNVDLVKVLKGLSFNTRFSMDYSNSYSQSFNNQYAVYEALWNNYAGVDQISSLNKYGEDKKTGVQNLGGSWQQQTTAFSGQFNYLTTLDAAHHISAMLIGTGFQRTESTLYHKNSSANLGLQLGYNYQHKYYADFSSAIAYSAKLPEGNRAALSPTFSLAWQISEEDFLKSSSVVDHLKLTASAGILNTDLDINDYYLYKGYYTQTQGAWYAWADGFILTQSTDSRRGDNPKLFYAKRKEISLGLETSLLKKLLTLDANFFTNRMDDIVTQAYSLYPNYFSTGWPNSSFIPYSNYNCDERIGFDFNVRLNKRVGQVDFSLGLTGLYYDTKAVTRDENFADAYQNRAGKPLDAIFGLQSDGFFTDEENITAHATQSFGQVKPGDIKYRDQNNDDVIDDKDAVYLGKAGWAGSPLTMGVQLTAKWKGLTFFALGTAHTGAYGMKDNTYYWVYGDRKYSAAVRDRWTEETKNTATYPRLSSQNNDNNFRSSDFWLYKNDRFNLSKIQISYDLPKNVLQKTFIRELGVYVSGSNLLTIAKEKKTLEMNVGGSPQVRFYNIGLKAAF